MSEGKSDADLGGEGNPNRGTGAEEITERAGGEEQLIAAGDRTSLGTRGGIEANGSDVGGIVHGRRDGADVRNVVVAGIIAIEEVEELGERRYGPAFVDFEQTSDAHIHLDVGRAAKFVKRGLHAINDRTVTGGRRSQSNGPRAFRLKKEGDVDAGRCVNRAGEHASMAHILSGRSVIAGGKGIEGVANAIDIVKQLSYLAAPSLRAGKRVVGDKI